MNNTTNTTVNPNTTSTTELNIPELIATLKHVRARREDFTQKQLVAIAQKTIPTLEAFYDQSDDEHNIGYLETAQGGIEHALDSLKTTTIPSALPLVPVLLLAIDAIEAVQEENE